MIMGSLSVCRPSRMGMQTIGAIGKAVNSPSPSGRRTGMGVPWHVCCHKSGIVRAAEDANAISKGIVRRQRANRVAHAGPADETAEPHVRQAHGLTGVEVGKTAGAPAAANR